MGDGAIRRSAAEAQALALDTTLNQTLYGVIAEFDDADVFLAAAHKAREAGYKKMDAYSPFPLEGLSEAMGFHDHKVPFTMLAGGIVGCLGGFGFLTWATVVSYPLNIGGRPIFGWPSWVPITFELTVLCSALSGIFGMILYNGLPMPYHPVFNAPEFDRASSDRFFLCIESKDPKFNREDTLEFMDSLGALRVSEVMEEH
jgi:hypothetical protein